MIRLRYTGLLVFASNILSLFTGLIFTSILARSLSKFDYGVWFFISSTLVYFQLFQSLVPFWGLRDSSRGLPVAKTCIAGNLLLSIPFMCVYIVMVPAFANAIGSQSTPFYLSSLFIPIYFVESGFNAIIQANFPHKMSYKGVIVDSIKLISIIWLIQLGLVGVISCVIVAYSVYLLFLFYVTGKFLAEKFSFTKLRDWLASSWIVLYGDIGGNVYGSLDILLLGFLSSASTLGSYGVALVIAGLIKMSSSLSSALYPKLLSGTGGKDRSIKDATMLSLMFLIPMTLGCVLLAPNLIDIFGSKYSDCLPAVYILSLNYFIGVLNLVANQVILGTEKADIERLSVRGLVRSSFFFVYSLQYVAIIIVVPLMLLLIPGYGMVGCATALLVTTTSIFLIKGLRAFRGIELVSYTRLSKFLLASLIMTAFITFIYGRGTAQTLLLIFSGSAIYFASLFIIDKETRDLARKTLDEIRSVINQ